MNEQGQPNLLPLDRLKYLGGYRDEGETLEQAGLRELREEAGEKIAAMATAAPQRVYTMERSSEWEDADTLTLAYHHIHLGKHSAQEVKDALDPGDDVFGIAIVEADKIRKKDGQYVIEAGNMNYKLAENFHPIDYAPWQENVPEAPKKAFDYYNAHAQSNPTVGLDLHSIGAKDVSMYVPTDQHHAPLCAMDASIPAGVTYGGKGGACPDGAIFTDLVRPQLVAQGRKEALNKEEILSILNSNDNVIFLTTGNASKQEELVRILDNPSIPVLNIKDLATLLGTTEDALESPENEENYKAIATGKVAKAKAAIVNSALPRELRSKMILMGDDYGASVGALRFTYDAAAPEVAVDCDKDGHIAAIRTQRPELDGQPAPGYFSKRVKNALARHKGIDPNDKHAAFNAFADEIFHAAEKNGDRSTSATVAIAIGRASDKRIHVVEETGNYTLVDRERMPDYGFDFDRIQGRAGEQRSIADWSSEEKDRDFPRGQAVRKALNCVLTNEKSAGFRDRVIKSSGWVSGR